jgi:hypothetical protein
LFRKDWGMKSVRLGQQITATVYGEPWTGRVIKITPHIVWAESWGGRVRWFHRDSLEG